MRHVFLAIAIGSVHAFAPSRTASCKLSLSASSEIPTATLDSFLKPSKSESPLVDRALDSALDFLQDGVMDSEEEEEDELDMFEVYEESPDIEIPYDLIAELEVKEAEALAMKRSSKAEMNQIEINNAIAKWRKHDKDVGSAEVQIVICHEKIKYLTKHLLVNKWDMSAKRGLQAMVNNRRKFLNYLYLSDSAKAELMVRELGIRFRPPGQLWDKTAKYGSYKNTKSKWQKLRQVARTVRDARASASASA